MRLLPAALLCAFLIASKATAQAENSPKKSLDVSRQMTITYGSPTWNTDSEKIDTAYIFLRDKNTGKIVHIQLEETEPDSSQFTGSFSVSLKDADRISPEIYVPEQSAHEEKDYKKVYAAIADGTLQRKPVIAKRNEKGQSVIEVYDTREQAAEALQHYQEQQKLALEQKKDKMIKPIRTEAALAAAKQAEHKAALDKLALETAAHEADRVRLEQIERQKVEERERQAKMISESERAARREKAVTVIGEADSFYAAADFIKAEAKYKQAVDLDPENRASYFKYGVSLYRNTKFNDALVALKLAKVEAAQDTERKYYMALCHYRLGELDPAIASFGEVAATKDPTLSPSAMFYRGVIHYAQEKFDLSKKDFEQVIDASNDPRMDEQAEEYIDRIASALAFKKMRENKFNFMGILGLTYDSNVLLSPDTSTDQGTNTNISDVRLLTVAELDYRPILNEHHELSVNGNASLTNSEKAISAKADPFLYNLAVPYSYTGVVGKKGYKMTAKPATEILYMDPNGTGTKSAILSSYLLTVDNTFVMNKSWFSTYTVEYRLDDVKTSDSVGPDDGDASKYSLRMLQAMFLDKSKKELILGNLGYVLNSAKGANKKYNRYEVGATYMRPIGWGSTLNLNLATYQLIYPSAEIKRKDFNTTLTTGFTKPIREWVTWGVLGTYTKNSSDQSANTYTKYTVMTTATFNTSF